MISNTETRCVLCPRYCRVDRVHGGRGFCGETSAVRAAAALLHFGEEPPVSGDGGSGTLFFSGCTLGCGFCQNRQISTGGMGRELSTRELADIFLRLEAGGAENINLVTATHFTPGIADAASLAEGEGLAIPFVWNSSGFDSPETLDLLSSFVSVYLPDLKTVSEEAGSRIYGTSLYAEAAKTAVSRMVRENPLRWDGGLMKQGVIVRHMVLPGEIGVSLGVIEWFAEHIGGNALFSLMFQYTPVSNEAGPRPDSRDGGCPEYGRRVSEEEYEIVMARLETSGIEEGFAQELENNGDWLPDFARSKPFPAGGDAERAKVVWHWRDGTFS